MDSYDYRPFLPKPPDPTRKAPMPTVLIVILAVTTLAFLGATIGLAVTRNKASGVPLCEKVPGYVISFVNIEDLTEQYISAVEGDDSSLLSSMLSEGKPFENGKLVFARQADVIAGGIAAMEHLGKDCESPGVISKVITERYTLADDYSKMTYEQFLASQEK